MQIDTSEYCITMPKHFWFDTAQLASPYTSKHKPFIALMGRNIRLSILLQNNQASKRQFKARKVLLFAACLEFPALLCHSKQQRQLLIAD